MSLWTTLGSEDGSVPALLRARRRLSGSSVYLRWYDRSWTFEQTLSEAERFAGFLKRSGDAPGARCGTYLPNCPEALWSWFGTLVAGNAYVPFNRAQRGDLLIDQIARARVSVLVVDEAALEEVDIENLPVQKLIVVGEAPQAWGPIEILPYAAVGESERWEGVSPPPLSLSTVMFSSGSTGRSKAVALPHNQAYRGAVNVAQAMGLRSDDVWHEWLPHYHMMGALYALLAPLAAGAQVDLRPRFSRSQFWPEVKAGNATVIGGMANVFRWLAEPDVTSTDTAHCVRLALIAGTDPEMKRAFADRFGVRVMDFYGMTECEPVTVPSVTRRDDWSHGAADADYDVAIVDAAGTPVAGGSVGEIVCRPRRPGVLFREYEEDPDSTVLAWRDLWFHTGDRGHLDDAGRLHFLERNVASLRHLGENVSAFELEQIITKAPGVAVALALGVPVGEGEDDVKVVVVPEADAELVPSDLHAWCRLNMASFMVPRYIEVRDALATFGIGKIDRNAMMSVDPPVWDAQAAALARAEALDRVRQDERLASERLVE
jgi:carnitine-CoA ligase